MGRARIARGTSIGTPASAPASLAVLMSAIAAVVPDGTVARRWASADVADGVTCASFWTRTLGLVAGWSAPDGRDCVSDITSISVGRRRPPVI